jgi:biotin transport system substrate-specific component
MIPYYNDLKSLKPMSLRRENVLLFLKRILFSLLFAGITGACAQIRIYLPFTPVPVTGQVFAVLLCGAVLGKGYGALSQIFYILLGLSGVPWFVIGPIGPTGGYLIGFILAPYLTGLLMEKMKKVSLFKTFLSMIAGVFVIYIFGLIQFSIFTHRDILESIPLAVLPFIPFDIIKAFIAAAAAHLFLKRIFSRNL